MINIKFPFICESERTYRYINACVCTHTTQKQEEAKEGKTRVRENIGKGGKRRKIGICRWRR